MPRRPGGGYNTRRCSKKPHVRRAFFEVLRHYFSYTIGYGLLLHSGSTLELTSNAAARHIGTEDDCCNCHRSAGNDDAAAKFSGSTGHRSLGKGRRAFLGEQAVLNCPYHDRHT